MTDVKFLYMISTLTANSKAAIFLRKIAALGGIWIHDLQRSRLKLSAGWVRYKLTRQVSTWWTADLAWMCWGNETNIQAKCILWHLRKTKQRQIPRQQSKNCCTVHVACTLQLKLWHWSWTHACSTGNSKNLLNNYRLVTLFYIYNFGDVKTAHTRPSKIYLFIIWSFVRK